MEGPKAEATEFFYGLRPDSRKAASRPTSTISRAKEEKPKTISAPDITITSCVESIRSEVMSKFATLEASLLAEIHESRVREEKLRTSLAKSRVVAKDLQAKLTKYDQENGEHGPYVSDKPEQVPTKPAPVSSSRASWHPPAAASGCGDLRQLARNQVIRSVQYISPQFAVDLAEYSYGGYIPWPRVLGWLEDHPEIVDTIGVNLHALRTI